MTYGKYLSLVVAIFLGAWLALDVAFAPTHNQLFGKTYFTVCELVRDNYFEDSGELKKWVQECFQRAGSFDSKGYLKALIHDIDMSLNKISISHLSLWDPLSMRTQWFGESRETGIRVRLIENHYIVAKLVEDGPGQRAGLLLGDEIIGINHQKVADAWQARSVPGMYQVLRRKGEATQDSEKDGFQSFQVYVETESIQINAEPSFDLIINDKTDKIGLLTIPSFVPDNFDKDMWLELTAKLSTAQKIIIDIRGNSGGNFVAMLRAVSPFFCKPAIIGQLVKPRRRDGPTEALEDNLDPVYQTEIIQRARVIQLKTFDDYGCAPQKLVVLIDEESASVTEVFAEALIGRAHSRIIGETTAGEVVQAVWHPLPLGSGFALSVPDSLFKTKSGKSLEGIGVRPQKTLEYDLDLARDGIDSWILDALTILKEEPLL